MPRHFPGAMHAGQAEGHTPQHPSPSSIQRPPVNPWTIPRPTGGYHQTACLLADSRRYRMPFVHPGSRYLSRRHVPSHVTRQLCHRGPSSHVKQVVATKDRNHYKRRKEP